MTIFFKKNQYIESLEIFCFLKELFLSLRSTNIFLKSNRDQYIESLQFFYFLNKLFFYLLDKDQKTTNPLILGLVKVIKTFYSWESDKISPYLQALKDQVFWESSKFYRETMQKFVDGKLNALEFAQEFSDRLLADREKANNLAKDFQKQANIELNPNIFEFSEIILNFELLLEIYQNEAEDLKTGELSENDLSFTQDSVLEGVKRALEKLNKYFID